MRIGEDFEKIEFDFLGLHLMEPNAFLGDSLIFVVALLVAHKVKKFAVQSPFFVLWRRFFLVFGLGFFVGGLGHLFYGYVGLMGKYPPLYLGILSSVFAEKAMVSLHPNPAVRGLVEKLIYLKLGLALVAATLVFALVDLSVDPSKGLIVTTINGAIGSVYALAYLGLKFARTLTPSFHYMWLAVLVLLPTALVQSTKFNLHPWFDRNDLSHLFVAASVLLYYHGLRGYQRSLKND
jgi:hypothetical protein